MHFYGRKINIPKSQILKVDVFLFYCLTLFIDQNHVIFHFKVD